MNKVAALPAKQLTTELVLQSNGRYSLDDVYAKHNLNADIYNVQPELGFYCLYRRRASDPHPAPIPDCPNITYVSQPRVATTFQPVFSLVCCLFRLRRHMQRCCPRLGLTT